MKRAKIQRGISSRHARAAGDGPKLGRVGRLRDGDGPAVEQRARRSGRNLSGRYTTPDRRRLLILWSLAFVAGTALVIGGFLMFWLRSQRGRAGAVAVDMPLQNVRIASKFVSPSETEAIASVKSALAIRNPFDVEKRFHLGGTEPVEVVKFLDSFEKAEGTIEGYDWLSSMDVDGMLMEGVLVRMKGKETPGERVAFLVPDDEGIWKVDYEAFARTSRPDWSILLEGQAERGEVRVFLAADSYYNGPFEDESVWSCFAMASPEIYKLLPEDHELLRGYCKIGTPQEKAMKRLFATGERMRRATLEIRRMEGADRRQFEITRVLSEEWVKTPRVFDELID
jgi:hypothetical protein